MIFESNTAFVFHDSCGFEAGRTSELDKVKEFLRKRSTNKELKDHVHVIWYCIPINDEARPITRAELNFFNECGTGRVPVIVLFTKADMLDAQTIKQLVNTGMDVEDAANKAPEESVAMFEKRFGQQLYKKKYPPKDHVYFRDQLHLTDMQNPTSDCSELLRKTAATFSDDTLLQLFLTVQQNNVALSIEYAIKRITELTFQGWDVDGGDGNDERLHASSIKGSLGYDRMPAGFPSPPHLSGFGIVRQFGHPSKNRVSTNVNLYIQIDQLLLEDRLLIIIPGQYFKATANTHLSTASTLASRGDPLKECTRPQFELGYRVTYSKPATENTYKSSLLPQGHLTRVKTGTSRTTVTMVIWSVKGDGMRMEAASIIPPLPPRYQPLLYPSQLSLSPSQSFGSTVN
ncbi:uncharacterized protein LACBIDRAFT_335108 [Laccaria bicolor S238N-H82]|uniref:Predicted protein n=1 Tax=Laccaria bicolor (strain S238N-H82 / ATCC MYA-4686) TaxID=486041 RepID=B0E1E0_LACBS|nr:uncharacterized protein LACBIDRAFT_335108 [Laccaria bicolor S238N-H82]EDQ99364.1 predicted protein [Laccaria bicolor S238N-H82]|eukprot:XP_001890010.1 predicted protein [Laccaria bicolor S238N-H82]